MWYIIFLYVYVWNHCKDNFVYKQWYDFFFDFCESEKYMTWMTWVGIEPTSLDNMSNMLTIAPSYNTLFHSIFCASSFINWKNINFILTIKGLFSIFLS